MSSYRPQSPDLSSYAPRSPDLSTTYRPQSPDLSGPPSTAQPTYIPQHTTHTAPPFAEHAYRGPTNAFLPTSLPSIPATGPQTLYGQPPPQYSMPPRGHIKEEDEEYLPDAYAGRAGIPPQFAHMPANGSSMGYPQMPGQQIKAEVPPDPTHGVVLKTSFPVARIKRIMQADEDIGKVAQVTPHVVSRALELFMIKLITASADHARGGPAGAGGSAGASKGPKRVLAQHLKRAIQADETFDFLADIIAKVPDAPASKAKKEAGSDSEEAKPKSAGRKGKKRKDSGDDF